MDQGFTITVSNVNDPPTAQDATFSVAEDAANFTIVGLVTASDPDAGDTLTYSITAGNDSGVFAINPSTGEIIVADNSALDFETTPQYMLTVQVEDTGTPVLADTATVTVNVTDANDDPTDIGLSSSAVDENEPSGTTVGTFTTTDPDTGQTHLYSLVAGSGDDGNASFSISGGELRTAESFDYETKSTYSIRVQTDDGNGGTFEKQFTITVTDANDAPVIDQGAGPLTVIMSEDGMPTSWIAPTLSATDADGSNTLTWSVSSQASNGTATVDGTGASPPTFTYSPDDNFYGDDSFEVQVSDGTATDTIQVNVTIILVNDTPVITGQVPLSTPEETELTITLDDLNVTDPDNTYPDDFTLSVQDGLNYSRVGNTITPAVDFNGELAVPVTVNDGTTSIMLQWDANVEPDLIGYRLYYKEGSSGHLDLAEYNGSGLTYVGAPYNGQTVDSGFEIVKSDLPDPDASIVTCQLTGFSLNEIYYFVVTAYDNDGFESEPSYEVAAVLAPESNVFNLTVEVTPVNDAPSILGTIPEQTRDEDAARWTLDLTAYESDVEDSGTGLDWSVSGVNTALFTAVITDSDNDILTFTPVANAHGSDVITLTLTDSEGGIATQDITVTLTATNDVPVVTDIPDQTIAESATFATITLDDYVGDVETADADMSWSYRGNVELTVSIDVNRVATITIPHGDWNGAETITFTATDDDATDPLSAGNAATFTVTAVNDAPVVTGIPDQTIAEGSTFTTIALDTYVSDVDNADTEMTWASSGSVELTVTITDRVATIGIPDADWNGAETITFTATDDDATDPLSAGNAATFTVTAVNDAPTISGTPATSVNEDTLYSFTPTVEDPDAGDTLTFSIENKPSWASFDTNTGTLRGTPSKNDVGTTTGIVITVTDSHGASASLAAFEIEVVNVNTDLRVQKTVNNLMSNVGDEVVFTITVINSDPSDAPGVQVKDILPSGLSYVSDDSGGSYNPDTGIWDIGDVSAIIPNHTVSLNITARVTHEGEILNIASIIAYPDNSNNSSGVMLNGGTHADLGIWKTVDNPSPNIGETITSTITVMNNGLDDATGVQVTDLLPVGLTYVDDDSEGSYDSDTEIWDIGNLDVGASATLQLTATVDSTDEKITTARISHSDQRDPDTTNNESTAIVNQDTVNHPTIADLAIHKMVNQSEVNAGDEVVFTVVLRNSGPGDATTVRIEDVLPEGLTFLSSKPSQGTYDEQRGEWDIGTIEAGSYEILDVVADLTEAGPYVNTARISIVDEFDPNNGNDSGEAIVTGLAADLSVQVWADTQTPTLGENLLFTITINNNGPNDATHVALIDVLPSGLTYQANTPSQGTYDFETGVWTVGSLASGASASLEIVSTADQPGDFTNTATRTASSPPDMNSGNDIGSVTITVPVDGDNDGIPDEWEIANGLNPAIDDSDQDPDDDGLNNLEEYQNGTDPNSVDTDTDSMPDGWEVTYGLDPLIDDASGDMDNDGYTNLEEYLYGTKPNDSNSKLQPPTADAGPDQTVDEGVTVTLDGSNSSDPDDGIASYLWEQTDGNPVTLSDITAAQPTFTSPNVGPDGESLTFQLTVTDYSGLQDTDTCIVNVTWENNPPTADAGPDQTVDEGVTVTLDGSNSSDPDDGIHRYLWTQTAGPSVTLSDATAVQPTFVTPFVDPDGIKLGFLLVVIDTGGLQSTDTCIVNVTWDNDPPTADAGPDQTVDEGVTVTLDGSNSSDPDDGIHRYLWTQTAGPSVTLSDATAVQPTFVTPFVDPDGIKLGFLLALTDNGGLVHTDVVSIDIVDNGIVDFPSDVVPTQSFTGNHIGFQEGSGGNITSFVSIDPASVPDTTNMPDNLIYGLIHIEVKPETAGGTVTVRIYLEDPAPLGYAWYKYGPNNGWYDYSDHVEFNADRDQVTLTLVDGGIGDDDGVANGVIVDTSGLGSAPTSVTHSGGGGVGCFIATAGFCSNRDRSAKILSEFRNNRLLTDSSGHRMVNLYYGFSPRATDYLSLFNIRR